MTDPTYTLTITPAEHKKRADDYEVLVQEYVRKHDNKKAKKALTKWSAVVPPWEAVENKGWKYEFGQLIFWSIVFGMCIVAIIYGDEYLLPLLKGTFCK